MTKAPEKDITRILIGCGSLTIIEITVSDCVHLVIHLCELARASF